MDLERNWTAPRAGRGGTGRASSLMKRRTKLSVAFLFVTSCSDAVVVRSGKIGDLTGASDKRLAPRQHGAHIILVQLESLLGPRNASTL